MVRIILDLITIILAGIPLVFIIFLGSFDLIFFLTLVSGAGIIIFSNVLTIYLTLQDNKNGTIVKLDRLSMIAAFVILTGTILGEFLAIDPIIPVINWEIIPFGFYLVTALGVFLLIFFTMLKVENSVAMVLTVPLLIWTLGAKLIIALWDVAFPPKLRELIPYLDVTRTFILSFTHIFADQDRLETEKALSNLEDAADQVDEIAEGYALRKSVGQGIDFGLTIVVFAFFGVLAILTEDLHIPPSVVALLFGSLALAFSTFAGLFGPFYGLAGACKQFTLRNGNYRAASFYKILEQIFSIPFVAASAGFLFLDLPPVDADTLEDFKSEMHEQLSELTENLASLMGRDKSAVPQKTRRMVTDLLSSTEQNLAMLDFRNIREETAREFALTYYQHEFSWLPWNRKTAVSEFAEKYYFDQQTGEENLLLIGDKIKAGQMDDDMVNNVLISAALKGIIQMEQKYQELLEDVELGQTCTGLAFGARQFLKDHYILKSKAERIFSATKNFFMGLFAIPIVFLTAFHQYTNRFFDELVDTIEDGIFQGRAKEHIRIRVNEVYPKMKEIVKNIDKSSEKKEKTPSEKRQRNWQVRRAIQRLGSMIWEVTIFPFMVIINSAKWIHKQLLAREKNPREEFEEAVAHAALVSMYDELFKQLVMQTHVTTAS